MAPEHLGSDLRWNIPGLCIGIDNFIPYYCKDVVPGYRSLGQLPTLSYYAHETWTANPTLRYRASEPTSL